MTALDELEKRLEGPGLIVALTKDEARDLLSAALASDHIGNSTTMVPALGVEGVAQIIRQHLNVPVSSCALLDIDEAARAIIAAMEKNDG
jgi:hypothetical protein